MIANKIYSYYLRSKNIFGASGSDTAENQDLFDDVYSNIYEDSYEDIIEDIQDNIQDEIQDDVYLAQYLLHEKAAIHTNNSL